VGSGRWRSVQEAGSAYCGRSASEWCSYSLQLPGGSHLALFSRLACTAAPAGRDGWIGVTGREPRFVAHRHWNIRDAMYFSDYVATRLRDTDPDSSWGAYRRRRRCCPGLTREMLPTAVLACSRGTRIASPRVVTETVSENLDRLLALTGVPRKQCAQAYTHMGDRERAQVRAVRAWTRRQAGARRSPEGVQQ
jgi:hypothetical protein